MLRIVFAIYYALSLIFAYQYDKYDTLAGLFQGTHSILFFLLSFSVLFQGFHIALGYLERYCVKQSKIGDYSSRFTWSASKIAGCILLCWLPVLIIYYPGSVDHDSFDMLNAWNRETLWSSHHPVPATVLLGLLMDFGMKIGDANTGAVLNVLVNILFMLVPIVLLIKYCKELKIGMYAGIAIVFFFSLCPIWSGYAQCIIKDSRNIGCCILFSLLFLKVITEPSWIESLSNKVLLFLIFLSVCLFRNTGTYLIFLSFSPYLLYNYYKNRNIKVILHYLSVLLMFFCVNAFFNKVVLPKANIYKGSVIEMMSIPIQQTARFIKLYPNEVSDKEKARINAVFEYDKIAGSYDPHFTDPVKAWVKYDGLTNKKIKDYFKAWESMGKRKPFVYLDATMNATYQYFAPASLSRARGTGLKYYIKEKTDPNSPNTGRYDVQYHFSYETRKYVQNILENTWNNIPVLGWTYHTGVYTWILMACAFLLLRLKKYRAFLGLLPAFINILFCISSPINGYTRYMLPVMATLPMLICWTMHSINEE